jgi:hypothetical protein
LLAARHVAQSLAEIAQVTLDQRMRGRVHG